MAFASALPWMASNIVGVSVSIASPSIASMSSMAASRFFISCSLSSRTSACSSAIIQAWPSPPPWASAVPAGASDNSAATIINSVCLIIMFLSWIRYSLSQTGGGRPA